MSNNSYWIQDELKSINLTDPRAHQGFFKIATELADRPADSIYSTTVDWASSKAIYRFFNNPNIDSLKTLGPHFESTS